MECPDVSRKRAAEDIDGPSAKKQASEVRNRNMLVYEHSFPFGRTVKLQCLTVAGCSRLGSSGGRASWLEAVSSLFNCSKSQNYSS